MDLEAVAEALGSRARRDEPLAPYTAMRVGGPADLLVVCATADEVVEAAQVARAHDVPWRVLGGGCNVLVADAGVRGLVIVNRAARTRIADDGAVWAESGASMAALARQTAERGLAGLEWAAGLPGTVGGAVVGNAGAFDGDVAATLTGVTLLTPDGEVTERPAEWMELTYRGSRLKELQIADCNLQSAIRKGGYVVLAAMFALQPGDRQTLAARVAEILDWRRTRHPSGATMGSTFKNPPGSHAGYLIEQAGLRGHRVGGAFVSELHGNFFMNDGSASASDVLALIRHVQAEIKRQFAVELELEIELIGEW